MAIRNRSRDYYYSRCTPKCPDETCRYSKASQIWFYPTRTLKTDKENDKYQRQSRNKKQEKFVRFFSGGYLGLGRVCAATALERDSLGAGPVFSSSFSSSHPFSIGFCLVLVFIHSLSLSSYFPVFAFLCPFSLSLCSGGSYRCCATKSIPHTPKLALPGTSSHLSI